MSDDIRRLQPRKAGRCPICATGLATGQGVYSCPSCEWTGVVEESTREGLVLAAREIPSEEDADGPNEHPTDYHAPPSP